MCGCVAVCIYVLYNMYIILIRNNIILKNYNKK